MWQFLAAYQLSETGFGRTTIIVHLCVLLANTFSPLVMAYVTTLHTQRNRKVLARITRRLLLFDSLCDLLYVVHLGGSQSGVMSTSVSHLEFSFTKHIIRTCSLIDLTPSHIHVNVTFVFVTGTDSFLSSMFFSVRSTLLGQGAPV